MPNPDEIARGMDDPFDDIQDQSGPNLMYKSELIAMLNAIPGDPKVAIAGTPDINDWVSDILPIIGKAQSNGETVIVLGASEAMIELDIKWPGRPV